MVEIAEGSAVSVRDEHIVPPPRDRLDEGMRVLRQGELFAVFDRHGDAVPSGGSGHGFYYEGTRFLSGLRLRFEGVRPKLLGSNIRDDALLTVDLANPGFQTNGQRLEADALHLFRSRFAAGDTFYETVRITNHDTEPVEARIAILFQSDFADLFEVRGYHRDRHGETRPPRIQSSGVELSYRGLDGRLRRTVLQCKPRPDLIEADRFEFALRLEPKKTRELRFSVTCLLDSENSKPPRRDAEEAFEDATSQLEAARARACGIRSSNEAFNEWLSRSAADLRMMTSITKRGPYPFAGVPWFNAIFGRDGIITARELLWVDPEIARGVLRTLAATQATAHDEAHDAEPGKIVHEMRSGEMAALGEVPFGRYYGTVDATPLFVMLARDYVAHTGDVETLRSLWPAVRRALGWIESHGDIDGDGLLEHCRRSSAGLVQHGWKDSDTSVFHADGRAAEGPISLCEVQAYAYAARLAVAEMAELLGETELCGPQREAAARLQSRFSEAFWCDDMGTFALALDGEKRACRVRSSNAGHCLFSGIATEEQGARLRHTLMQEDSFSGWGIRTISSRERRYNPMSYHNGSVWPHDTAIVASGLARYGGRDAALAVLDGLFHASSHMELYRMPELFCGFHARPGQGPTLYPRACAPQAWAAGSVFLLLEACLGLEIRGASHSVLLRHPVMPPWLDWIELTNLQVGDTRIDLLLRRARSGLSLEVLDKDGDAAVHVTKTV